MKRKVVSPIILLILFLFLVASPHTLALLSNGIITTVAGTGVAGFGGDGGQATQAMIYQPSGIVTTPDGTTYFSDQGNQRIRKINNQGIISTIAGNGTLGLSGDGGPAINASMRYPEGIAVDGQGNVYFADVHNHKIRKIDTAGFISTIAGVDVCTLPLAGDGHLAIDACLYYPTDAKIDTLGNIYIVDSANNNIRRIDVSTNIITSIAGNFTSGYSGDGGPATSSQLNRPWSMAFDYQGNIYITDRGNQRIRKIDKNGTITAVAGTGEVGFSGDGGPAINAKLNHPVGILTDILGNIYFTDFENFRVRKIDANGIITTVAGGGSSLGDNGDPTLAFIEHPHSLTFKNFNELLITDFLGHRIRLITFPPAILIQDLIIEVKSFNLTQGIENSLDVKLQNAVDSLNAENSGLRQDAINKLQAFIQAVEAQRGYQITNEQADILIKAANGIISSL